MKGFKIKPPKYIVKFEKDNKIVGYIWEYVRDKFHNIVSSKRTHGVTASGEKFPFPRNEAVEKAVKEAKKVIRIHFKENEKLKEVVIPRNSEHPKYAELIELRKEAEEKANKTAKNAREAIKAVELAEVKKK